MRTIISRENFCIEFSFVESGLYPLIVPFSFIMLRWVTADQELFSGILGEDGAEPLFEVNTTYFTVIDYMDYLEEK